MASMAYVLAYNLFSSNMIIQYTLVSIDTAHMVSDTTLGMHFQIFFINESEISSDKAINPKSLQKQYAISFEFVFIM